MLIHFICYGEVLSGEMIFQGFHRPIFRHDFISNSSQNNCICFFQSFQYLITHPVTPYFKMPVQFSAGARQISIQTHVHRYNKFSHVTWVVAKVFYDIESRKQKQAQRISGWEPILKLVCLQHNYNTQHLSNQKSIRRKPIL